MLKHTHGSLVRTCGLLLTASLAACGDNGTAEETGTPMTSGATDPATTTGDPPLTTTATPTTTEDPPTTTATPTTATPTTSGDDTGPEPMTGTTDETGTTTDETGTTMAVSESDSSSSSTGGGCEAPLSACGDACVDTQTDVQHCGGCDQPCGAGELCGAGECALDCGDGQVVCGDACVDTQNDPLHCGECDKPCGPGELCGAGACALDCPMGQEACGGSCVDTQTDPQHCGGCGNVCGMCEQCVAGGCAAPPELPAPPAIMGQSKPCADAEEAFTVPEVPGATTYTWTVPGGAAVTEGQGTPKVKIKFGAADGQVCVSYSDGCAMSKQTCVDVMLAGGVPGQKTFAAAAMVQSFVVPACISTVKITAFGAQGGSVDGGTGARMSGSFAVTPGESLGVVAGQQGVTNTCGGGLASGGGGGGSFVWRELNKTEPLIAAGGGGGGNTNWGDLACRKGLDGVTTINGTQGRGAMSALGGVNGLGGAGNAPSGTGAGGAGWKGNGQDSTWNSPATGGKAPFTFTGGVGSPGFGPGGDGGFGGGGGAVCGCGGGGGYSGGGAGEGSSCRAGGGGGGSFNAGMNQDNLAGARAGDGEVTIVWP